MPMGVWPTVHALLGEYWRSRPLLVVRPLQRSASTKTHSMQTHVLCTRTVSDGLACSLTSLAVSLGTHDNHVPFTGSWK